MNQVESLADTISSGGLFWGQPELEPWVSRLTGNEKNELFHAEIHDWVSSIYWGETLGVQYALLMSDMAESPNEREFWLRVMGEEVDHQQRIASWLAVRGQRPLAPNRLLQEAMERVANATGERSRTKKGGTQELRTQERKALADLILWGQVFFEELGAVLIRWRLPYVVDRELRAVLFKIYSDEMVHISAGKRALEALGTMSPSRSEILSRRASVIFPIHLIPVGLSEWRQAINRAGIGSVRVLLSERIGETERYRPSPLLQRWMKVDGYHCIGCHPKRSEGLQLDPQFDPVKGEAHDTMRFSRRFEGMNDMVHGGFISMVLDEVMGYAVNHSLNRLAFTTQLRVEFLRPVKIGRDYRISAQLTEDGTDHVPTLTGSIVDLETGTVVARSKASFFILTEATAGRLLPGALACPETRAMLGT